MEKHQNKVDFNVGPYKRSHGWILYFSGEDGFGLP